MGLCQSSTSVEPLHLPHDIATAHDAPPERQPSLPPRDFQPTEEMEWWHGKNVERGADEIRFEAEQYADDKDPPVWTTMSADSSSSVAESYNKMRRHQERLETLRPRFLVPDGEAHHTNTRVAVASVRPLAVKVEPSSESKWGAERVIPDAPQQSSLRHGEASDTHRGRLGPMAKTLQPQPPSDNDEVPRATSFVGGYKSKGRELKAAGPPEPRPS